MTHLRSWSSRHTCALIIAAYTLAAYNPDRNGGLDMLHEGERLGAVYAFRAGALPFRDVYVAQGLGVDVLTPLLACRLFGDSVAAIRALGTNSYLSRGFLPPLGTFMFLVAVAALTRRPRYVAMAGGLVLLTWCAVTDRHALGLLGLGALAAFAHFKQPRWLAAGGLLAAWAALYSLEVGCYLLAAAVAWAALDSIATDGAWRARGAIVRARVGWLLAGATVGALPFVAWCVWHGILGDFVDNAYIQVAMRRELFPPRPYPQFAWGAEGLVPNLLAACRTLTMFYAPPLLAGSILVLAWVFRRELGGKARSVLFLSSLLALFFWVTVLGRPDIWHVAYAVPAVLLALVTFVSCFRPGSSHGLVHPASQTARARLGLARTIMLALLGLNVTGLALAGHGGTLGWRILGAPALFPEIYRTRGKELVPCRLERCGDIRVDSGQLKGAERAVKAIQKLAPSEDDTILDLSDRPLLYFLSGRRSPTRFFIRSTWSRSQRLQSQVLAEILAQERPPACVVRPSREAPSLGAIDDWLAAHYVLDDDTGRLQFWRPR